MLNRFLIIILSILLSVGSGLRSAQAQPIEEARLVAKARADIHRLGVGRDARVEVRLRDKTRLRGYLSEAGEESFTVTDSKTGASRTIAYADVTQVKKPGGGVSMRAWVLIGAAAAAAVIVAITVKPAVCDGGAQDRFPC